MENTYIQKRTMFLIGAAIWFAATILLICHAEYNVPYFADDSFISLRYADRLLHGFGLTWTDGPRVEGYSNLLWVLACAAIGKIGFDLIDAARIIGILGMSAAIAAVVYAYRPKRFSLVDILPPIFGAFVLSLSSTIAIWTIGGLEQPLIAAFLAWMIVLLLPTVRREIVSLRSMMLPGLFGGLLCLTRPDSPLFIVAVCLGIFMRRGANKQTVVLLAAFLTIPIIIVAGQELFRILYYGDWVPNTARVKVAFSSVHLLFGIYYLKSGIYRNFPLFLFVLTALILSYQKKIKREDIELYLFPFVLWCLYLVLLGGDNFYFHRQFIPLIVLSAFVLSYLFVQLLSSKKIMIGKRIITGGVVILLIVQEFLQITDPDKRLVLKDIQWVNISKTIGLTLGQTFYQQRPSIAIDAAGGIPYWSQLPSLDMLGLNDSYIPRHPPADYDSKLIGHGMGNGEYVFNKKPDIVCFNSIGGFKTILPGGMQMFSNPLFYQNYVPLKLQFYNPSSLRVLLWINKQSEKIGLQTKTDSLCIPGWLMNQDSIQIHSYPLTDDTLPIAAWFGEGNGTAPGASAQLDENNRLATFFTAATPARMNNIVLAPGTWRVAMEPLDTNEQFIIYPYLGTSTVLQNMDTQFTLSDSTLVNIVIAPKDSAVHKIRVLRFLRCND